MQRILFRPFDLGKWFVIGFAAFLASFSAGIHFNLSPLNLRQTNFNYRFASSNYNMPSSGHMPGWIWPVAIVGGFFLLLAVGLLMWLGARGRFILTDCMVRNRGAIQQPWREFREEGNSFFLFSLSFMAIFLVAILVLGIPLFFSIVRHQNVTNPGPAFIIYLVFFSALIILLALGWSLITQLMTPIMFRRRCRAFVALKETLHLLATHPGSLVLYFLFLFVLVIACAIVAIIATCLTCCVAAIPYIGQVILLPVSLTLYGFTLFFLKQFGPTYDVWAEIETNPVASTPLSESPPLQT